MKKMKFENGTLINKAKVIIDNTTYDVEPAEYEGTTPLSAETLNEMQDTLLQIVFPIGSTYITQNDTNPGEILEFGTWERLKGKVCLGLDEEDEDLDAIGKTGGEKEHTLTIPELPSHALDIGLTYGNALQDDWGNEGKILAGAQGNGWCTNTKSTTSAIGANESHNNMQPFEVVGYMWIRRA